MGLVFHMEPFGQTKTLGTNYRIIHISAYVFIVCTLTKKQQGYYNYLKGIMVSQTNMNEAEKYFKKAISFGLSIDHDLAMAKLNLAGIAFSKRRKIEAQKLLSEAQKLDKRNMLADQVKMMKAQMKKGQMPNQHYGGQRSQRR